MTQLRRTGSMAEHFGVDVHIISPAEAAEIWPLANLDDIIGAAWLPHDGRAEPGQLPRAIGEGARQARRHDPRGRARPRPCCKRRAA